MDRLASSAAALLSQAEQRLEIAAHNIANGTTPGYRRQIAFAQMLAPPLAAGAQTGGAPSPVLPTSSALHVATILDNAPGAPIETGAPLDLTATGDAFLVLRGPDGMAVARTGVFRRDDEGRIALTENAFLQLEGGGDLVTATNAVDIGADGVVTDGAAVIGRLAFVRVEDQSLLTARGDGAFSVAPGAATQTVQAGVRQGVLTASNVKAAAEMLAMMGSVRTAEAGQQAMRAWDEMLGRVLDGAGQT